MTMAGRRAHAQALCLVVLFVMSSWLSLVAPAGPNASVLAEENVVSEAGQGDVMNLTLTPTPNTMFKLDLPAGEPLVNAELNFTPKILPTQSDLCGIVKAIGRTRMRFPTAQASPTVC